MLRACGVGSIKNFWVRLICGTMLSLVALGAYKVSHSKTLFSEGGTLEWDPGYSAMTEEPLAQDEAIGKAV